MKFKVILMDENEENEWSPSKLFKSEEDAEDFINDSASYNTDGRFNGWTADVFPCDGKGEIIEDSVLTITDLTNE